MEYRYFYFLPTYTFIDVKLVESGRWVFLMNYKEKELNV